MSEDLHTNNNADFSAIAAKSILGAIPVAGSFLAEIVSAIIPNQRMERVARYAEKLNDRLDKLPEDMVEKLRNNEQFIDLIEESLIRVSRASSDERRKYILNIAQTGISDDVADINNAKYLLGLLSDLNDIEVIWLRYFHESTMHDRGEFRELHKNILDPIPVTLGSEKEERNAAALQESYKEHLERLGLIKYKIRMDKKLGLPEFDKRTGKPKTSSAQVTTLGAMLLESIGLIEENERP